MLNLGFDGVVMWHAYPIEGIDDRGAGAGVGRSRSIGFRCAADLEEAG